MGSTSCYLRKEGSSYESSVILREGLLFFLNGFPSPSALLPYDSDSCRSVGLLLLSEESFGLIVLDDLIKVLSVKRFRSTGMDCFFFGTESFLPFRNSGEPAKKSEI